MARRASDASSDGRADLYCCSTLCDPPVEFATRAEFDDHYAFVHSPAQEIAIGGSGGPVFVIRRTSRGYVCPRAHGPYPLLPSFYKHLRTCAPRPIDLQSESLPASWELISGTIPAIKVDTVISNPGQQPTGRTSSGRLTRAPAARMQPSAGDVPPRPTRSRRTAIKQTSSNTSNNELSQSSMPWRVPQQGSSWQPPQQQATSSLRRSVPILRPSGARKACNQPPRPGESVLPSRTQHSSKRGLASTSIEGSPGGSEAPLDPVSQGGLRQKKTRSWLAP